MLNQKSWKNGAHKYRTYIFMFNMIVWVSFQFVFNFGGTFNLGELLRNLNFINGQLISFHRNIARISNIKYKHIEILLVISLFQTILHWFPWKLRNTYLVVKHSGFSKMENWIIWLLTHNHIWMMLCLCFWNRWTWILYIIPKRYT